MILRKPAIAAASFVLAASLTVSAVAPAVGGDIARVHFKSPHQLGASATQWEYEATWNTWRSCPFVTNTCHINIWSDTGIDERRDSLFYSEAGRAPQMSGLVKIVQAVHKEERLLGLTPKRHRSGPTFYWIWQGVTANPQVRTRLVLAVQGTRYGMLHQQAAGPAPFNNRDYVQMSNMVTEALRLANPASGFVPVHGNQDFILIEP